jgi:xanthine/uracil permease
MIAVSGIRLLAAAKPTLGNNVVAGTTLVIAIGLPIYARYSLGEGWLASLPSFASLVVTNPVVLAVLLGVGLHAILNLAAGGGAEEAT